MNAQDHQGILMQLVDELQENPTFVQALGLALTTKHGKQLLRHLADHELMPCDPVDSAHYILNDFLEPWRHAQHRPPSEVERDKAPVTEEAEPPIAVGNIFDDDAAEDDWDPDFDDQYAEYEDIEGHYIKGEEYGEGGPVDVAEKGLEYAYVSYAGNVDCKEHDDAESYVESEGAASFPGPDFEGNIDDMVFMQNHLRPRDSPWTAGELRALFDVYDYSQGHNPQYMQLVRSFWKTKGLDLDTYHDVYHTLLEDHFYQARAVGDRYTCMSHEEAYAMELEMGAPEVFHPEPKANGTTHWDLFTCPESGPTYHTVEVQSIIPIVRGVRYRDVYTERLAGVDLPDKDIFPACAEGQEAVEALRKYQNEWDPHEWDSNRVLKEVPDWARPQHADPVYQSWDAAEDNDAGVAFAQIGHAAGASWDGDGGDSAFAFVQCEYGEPQSWDAPSPPELYHAISGSDEMCADNLVPDDHAFNDIYTMHKAQTRDQHILEAGFRALFPNGHLTNTYQCGFDPAYEALPGYAMLSHRNGYGPESGYHIETPSPVGRKWPKPPSPPRPSFRPRSWENASRCDILFGTMDE